MRNMVETIRFLHTAVSLTFVADVEQILARFKSGVYDEVGKRNASEFAREEYLRLVFRATSNRDCVGAISPLLPLTKVLSLLKLTRRYAFVSLTALGSKIVVARAFLA